MDMVGFPNQEKKKHSNTVNVNNKLIQYLGNLLISNNATEHLETRD